MALVDDIVGAFSEFYERQPKRSKMGPERSVVGAFWNRDEAGLKADEELDDARIMRGDDTLVRAFRERAKRSEQADRRAGRDGADDDIAVLVGELVERSCGIPVGEILDPRNEARRHEEIASARRPVDDAKHVGGHPIPLSALRPQHLLD